MVFLTKSYSMLQEHTEYMAGISLYPWNFYLLLFFLYFAYFFETGCYTLPLNHPYNGHEQDIIQNFSFWGPREKEQH